MLHDGWVILADDNYFDFGQFFTQNTRCLKPFIRGIKISISTTSGLIALAFSIASSPSTASPQIVHPGREEIRDRRLFLTISLSSTMSI